ncbi:MAG TPA: type I-E CRISPR-associated protein Cas6/Cse3/CasE [Amycolatopsis sp.]|uniref:type I-E CRISPR-associated protein Cas6/Cse3/CasE n=1 Tax=Amycolatopsis sp. TaxID=37632 RepID=UPI002B487907|nr:type I-E CRISPR-associated protein Cas6/Cse3/CasE [Amycolatopsis sp.]HKS45440.1 type I-E CRISPR-associated protein Cas6/Cse3/CasE [Amycolatopsis sp.]
MTSREFRRDYADIHQMHRTVMSVFPDVTEGQPARQAHGVLWRLDTAQRGFALYVQSQTKPDWVLLANGYLSEPAQIRDLQPVLDAIQPGRKLAFRLVANPTRSIHQEGNPGQRGRGKRVPHRKPDKQVEWLARQGERHGFVIPIAANGQADVAPSSTPTLRGHKNDATFITVEPVRYDGHLIVTDPGTFTRALLDGIGRAKAFGCGLITVAPPISPTHER